MMKTIIYCATLKSDGRKYVGQTTVGIAKRRWRHIYDATHPSRSGYNTAFARAIRKYGADAFTWKILACVPAEMLDELEELAIKKYRSLCGEWGFNIDLGGYGPRGRKLSAEHAAKIGAANRGKARSAELREQISRTKRGKPGRKLMPGELEKLIAAQHRWRVENPELAAEKARKHGEFMKAHFARIAEKKAA